MLKNKIMFAFLTGVSLLSLATIKPSPISAATNYINVLKENTPVYENWNGNLNTIGYLSIHQEFPIIKDVNTNWYEIKYGHSFAYVYKGNIKTTSKPNYKNSNVGHKNSRTSFITTKDTPVYDNTSGHLQKFAIIKDNRKYPVLYSSGNWYAIDFGGRIGFVSKSLTKLDKGVPVLMYHHLLYSSENIKFRNSSTTMTPEQFKQQMEYLHNQGYTTITTVQLEQYLKGNIELPGKSVLITFDDGLKTANIYAYPILKQYGMKATEFMITSRTYNTPTPFNPLDLQFISKPEMASMSDVFEFQGHTHHLHQENNKKQSDVITKPKNFVLNDFITNREFLNATALAYPFGQYNSTTIDLAKQAGFKSAYTTKPGYNTVGEDLFQINRFGIEPGTSFSKFVSIFN